MDIAIKRVYEPAGPDDGARVLVDRLWPRGLSRDKARIDVWLKDIAPSAELRTWFGHDPARWEEFRSRYQEELRNNPHALERLVEAARGWDRLTLLYGARDQAHNQALVLKDFLTLGLGLSGQT